MSLTDVSLAQMMKKAGTLTWTRVDSHSGEDFVVGPDQRLSRPRTLGIGAQHVVAMFGATFLVPVLTGFPPATTLFSPVSGRVCSC